MKIYITDKDGFTFVYEGARFEEDGIKYSEHKLSNIVGNSDNIPPNTWKFCRDFNEIGSLIMRFHFGHGQRSTALAQIVRANYKDYAMESPGIGNDQIDFFDVSDDAPKTTKDSLKLQQLASYPLGEAKILNRLAQGLHRKNTIISGEQGLFGTMHAAVWQPAISLASFLSKNGFKYILCSPDITPEQYDEISSCINRKEFSLENDGTNIRVKEQSWGIVNLPSIQIHIQEQPGLSFQENGLLIKLKEFPESKHSPLGWIIHTPTKEVLAQNDTEDLMRLFYMAEGGFYRLSASQQETLTSGRLADNDRIRVTQNRQLNTMLSLFTTLETKFGFNPTSLIDNVLKQVAKATKKSIQETSVLDDFLTGIVLTEMIQPLMVTKKSSERTEFPPAFNLNYRAIYNNAKAIAYAFDMKDGQGNSLLHNEDKENPFYDDPQLPDLGIQGTLLAPSLTDSRHCAAILATAILVTEQILLEQLLAQELQSEGNERQYSVGLRDVLHIALEDSSKTDTACQDLVTLAGDKPQLGLQCDNSDELIAALRHYIGTDILFSLATMLGRETYSTPEAILQELPSHALEASSKAMKQLHVICATLQTIPGIAADTLGSRGTVVGTTLVITKLFPTLAQSLALHQTDMASTSLTAEEQNTDRVISPQALQACPFLNSKYRGYNAPIAGNKTTSVHEQSMFNHKQDHNKNGNSKKEDIALSSYSESSPWELLLRAKKSDIAIVLGITLLLVVGHLYMRMQEQQADTNILGPSLPSF